MRIAEFKRWQWIAISLVCGLAVGLVRQPLADADLNNYGNSLSQVQFERALFQKIKLADGREWGRFKDPVVFKAQVQDPADPSRTKPAYVVFGSYHASSESEEGAGRWRASFFIADQPYKPIFSVPPPVAGAAPAFSRRARSLAEAVRLKATEPADTVISYLERMQAAGRVTFSYAWWREPRVSVVLWLLCSLAILGGLVPTLINLVVYGRLSQPPSEPASFLSAADATPEAVRHGPSQQDLDRLNAMTDALEKKLQASAVSRSDIAAPAATPVPIRKLDATAVEVAAQHDSDSKEFGADKDDFYPTERHTHPKQPHEPNA